MVKYPNVFFFSMHFKCLLINKTLWKLSIIERVILVLSVINAFFLLFTQLLYLWLFSFVLSNNFMILLPGKKMTFSELFARFLWRAFVQILSLKITCCAINSLFHQPPILNEERISFYFLEDLIFLNVYLNLKNYIIVFYNLILDC